MVKNPDMLRKFEIEDIRKARLSFKDAVKITEALWHEALALGAVKSSDWLKDVGKEIRIAKIVNGI